MNCELAHERIVSAAYGELPDEQMHELDRHIRNCSDCGTERAQLLALKVLAEANPVIEPDANLVARSRQRLEEALDALPPKRWYEWLSQRMMNNFAALQAAPIGACLLLIVGAGAGVLGGYEVTQSQAADKAALQQPPIVKPPPPVGDVANVLSIAQDPNSQMVEVTYNQMVPQRMRGTLDDPQIRQLLMLASQNSESPARVRDDSVGLLVAECRAGHSCQATGIRDALMVLLRYDQDEGVRAKALEGLQPFVAEDMQVRNAVLEALMNDSDPKIRTSAISILEPVESDSSVRQALHTVANSDANPQIRIVSRQVLSRVPQFQ